MEKGTSSHRERRKSDRPPTAHRRESMLSRVFSKLPLRKQNTEVTEDTHGRLGLTLLFTSPAPLADLIFVHGLGGGSRKTWDKGRDPDLFWPKEWLSRDPDFDHVRAHSFGYHADWTERRESILDISDIAGSLLAHLQTSSAIRRGNKTPLVFVCHSMGGLVVKKALILAHLDPGFHELGRRFDTIYFLATPHHGAASARLLSMLIKATYSGHRPFVCDLKQDSPAIQAINNEFRHYSNDLRLYSFFETKPTHVPGVGNIFLVTKSSATMQLPNERITPIEADHPGVSKYFSPSDPNYILIRDSIVETLDRFTESWKVANDEVVKSQRHSVRQFLRIPAQMQQAHLSTEEPRVEGSCEWLTLEVSFRRWRDSPQSQIFWLSGNPGTGKSFLASYVVSHISDLNFDCSSFFFSAGDKTRSSIRGCLLSLAWQMAERNISIRDKLFEMHESENDFDPDNFQSIWRTIFEGGILQATLFKPHFWVLDGLDECIDHHELFPLLVKVRKSLAIHIFISSRPRPDVRASLVVGNPDLEDLEIGPHHTTADIERYVRNHVDFPADQKQSAQQDLLLTILEKSEGSFLWVRLVLKELRGAFSTEAIRATLNNVPRGMDRVYQRSLQPLAAEESRRLVAKAILMWASTSKRPLSISELRDALMIHINQTFTRLEDHISWLCGYLVTTDGGLAVKMVHETARTFILDEDNGSPIGFCEEEAHETLAIVCLKYLTDKELKAPRGRRSSSQRQAASRSPFLDYAAVSFHEHIHSSKTLREEIVDLVYAFCSSSAANILTWIEYIAAVNRNISVITRAGTLIRSFVVRVAKDYTRRTDKLDLIERWSVDLLRIVAKFGRNLVRFPASIYNLIPGFCPRMSAIYRQYGQSHAKVSVLGLPSLLEWDDCLATIVCRQKGTRAVSVAAAANSFAVGMSNSYVQLYHANTCEQLATFHHGEAVQVVEFSIAGQWLATCGGGKICVWDIGTKKRMWEHRLPRPVIALAFLTEDEEMVVACQDNQLHYFEVRSGKAVDAVPWFKDEDHAELITNTPVTAAISHQHQLFASVYRGGHIGIWSLETDEFLGFCEKPNARRKSCPFHASSLVFSPVPNSNCLAASYEQGEILVFNPLDGEITAHYKEHTDDQTLACSPDGRTLTAADSSGVIRIFDFQSFDSPGGLLKLLYVISGMEENIRALAFCDNKRFVDIRGSSVKVWEPTVLIRQDSASQDTVSINSQDNIQSHVEEDTPSPITSLSAHPSGKHVFCANHQGKIQVYETATGKIAQVLCEHFQGDDILCMIFSPTGNILATAGISSKVVLYNMEFEGEWRMKQRVFEHRMGERIEQLLFNTSGDRILVVTTALDMVYSIVDKTTASVSWDTRLPGVWSNDPRDPNRLLLFVGRTLRIFTWSGLEELTPPAGLRLDFELPAGFGIQSVYPWPENGLIATTFSEVDRARAHTRVVLWNASEFNGSNHAAPPSPVAPSAAHQPHGDRISELLGTLGMMIGFLDSKLLFLDQDGWVCTMALDSSTPDSWTRHFFLPVD